MGLFGGGERVEPNSDEWRSADDSKFRRFRRRIVGGDRLLRPHSRRRPFHSGSLQLPVDASRRDRNQQID